jgi:hypothetical protein
MVAMLLALALALAADSPPASALAEAPVTTSSEERCKIVVLNVEGAALAGDDAQLPAILTQTIAREVAAVSACAVVSQADVYAMLEVEKQKQICTEGASDSCLAEIGQALGAERVVGSTLGKLGAEYIVSARLMNVTKGAVDQRAEERVGASPEKLHLGTRNVARRLFGAPDIVAPPEPAATQEGGVGPLVFAGLGIAAAGALVTVPAGIVVGVMEARLAERDAEDKDQTRTVGLVALAGGIAGLVVIAAGGALAFVGLE